MNSKICLCVVFNHPFKANIPVLESIYRSRFSNIKYLMPFEADCSNPDIITVYRGSYQHQGFVTDAYPILREVECEHFIFVQDDVLLNPRINQENVLDWLGCGQEDGFICQLSHLSCDAGGWHWILGILWKMFYPRNQLSGTGVDSLPQWLSYLPPLEEAMARARRYNIGLPTISRTQNSLSAGSVVRSIPYFGTSDEALIVGMNSIVLESLFSTADGNAITMPYPFATTGWAADFYVLPQYALRDFSHYSGVMAAAGTFAEISVGTALMLSCNSVVTAERRNLRFEWLWSVDREYRADHLIGLFDEGYTAVHPIKLSRISDDETLDKIRAMGA